MSVRNPDPVSTPGTNSDPVSFSTIISKIMPTAIIIILLIVILIVSLHLYSLWYLHRHRRFNRSHRTAAAITFFTDPSSPTVVTTQGLDPSLIKSLPIFTFSAPTATTIECAVCLSGFVDNESGRVLPNCKHAFHVDCIDMWFHSHSSCPLCRSLVEPITGGVKSTMEEVSVSISDTVSGDDQSLRPELCHTNSLEGTGTCDILPPEDHRRKLAAIEIPRMNLGELENDMTRSHSLRSPISRMVSFTRILSRERRSASSSSSIRFPSMVSPPPCSMPVTELDIELGGEETR